MISFLLQTAGCVAWTVITVWALGLKMYFVLAIAASITAIGCLFAVPGRYEGPDPIPLVDILQTFLVGCFLGALWPALPVIVAVGAARNRADRSSSGLPLHPIAASGDHRKSEEE